MAHGVNEFSRKLKWISVNCKDVQDESINLPGLGLSPGSAPWHNFSFLAQKEEFLCPPPPYKNCFENPHSNTYRVPSMG